MATLQLTIARLDAAHRMVLAVLMALFAVALLAVAAVSSALLLTGGDLDQVTRGLLWVGDITWRR